VFPEANYVAAVIRLRAFNDTFLYVARLLDPRVVAQLRQTEASVAEYAEIEARRLGIQVNFAVDVRGDRADYPDGVGIDRAEFRQLAGRPDPPADERRQYRFDRRSACAGAGPQVGGRPRAARRDLQQDDAGAAQPARRTGKRKRPHRQPPPLFIEAVLSSASAGIIASMLPAVSASSIAPPKKLIGHAESETLDHPLSDVLPELDDMMKTAREARSAGTGPDHDSPRRP